MNLKIDCISEYKKVFAEKPYHGFDIKSIFSSAQDKFKITKHRDGKYPAIITISGFLSEEQDNRLNWENSILKSYPDREWFHLEWEAKKFPFNKKIDNGELELYNQKTTNKYEKIIKKIIKIFLILGPIGLIPFTLLIKPLSLIGNPILSVIIRATYLWQVAKMNSESTGQLLGRTLSSCPDKQFILVGHSLGTRVIHSSLNFHFKNKIKSNIVELHLLGGAVNSRNKKWENESTIVPSAIYNYYPTNDNILKHLYSYISIDIYPIGLGRVEIENFTNIDVSNSISDHFKYMKNFHLLNPSTSNKSSDNPQPDSI